MMYHSLGPPHRNEWDKCLQAGTVEAGGDTKGAYNLPAAPNYVWQNTLSQKNSFTVALLSGLESDSPFSCC